MGQANLQGRGITGHQQFLPRTELARGRQEQTDRIRLIGVILSGLVCMGVSVCRCVI